MSREINYTDMRGAPFVAPTFTANAYTTVLADLQTILGVDASGAEKTVSDVGGNSRRRCGADNR